MENKPVVTIIGSLHGNERVGAEVIELLKKEFGDQSNLNFLVGNPAAYEEDKRFLDTDLNRLFGKAFDELKTKEVLNREEVRALELGAILEKSDYLIDIHCTLKPSLPFVFCENNEGHLELATIFETKYIVSPALDFHPEDLVSSADNFVDRHGGRGFTYETGWYKEPESAKQILRKVKKFLAYVGAVEEDQNQNLTVQKISEPWHFLINQSIIAESDQFSFVEDFDNFKLIPKGTKIAVDAGKNVFTDNESHIIFPKSNVRKGQTACYLAVLYPWG